MEFESKDQKKQFNVFIEELIKWNAKINLIGRKSLSEIMQTHIRDSLFLLPFLDQSSQKLFVDIGSGGGFPVIPLALLRPNYRFIATDVIQKKLDWLEYISSKLHLSMEVVNPSHWILKEECALTSRAFSEIKNILKWKNKHTPFATDLFLLKGKEKIVLKELKDAELNNFKIYPQEKGCVVQIYPNQ